MLPHAIAAPDPEPHEPVPVVRRGESAEALRAERIAVGAPGDGVMVQAPGVDDGGGVGGDLVAADYLGGGGVFGEGEIWWWKRVGVSKGGRGREGGFFLVG